MYADFGGPTLMDEISVANDLLKDLEDEGKRHGVASISRVHVKIARRSLVSSGQLLCAFKKVSEGTVAEGAELAIAVDGGTDNCDRCGSALEDDSASQPVLLCSHCGSTNGDFVSGRPFRIALVRGSLQTAAP
jgi:hydrogenase nickel insertion protein HypA